MKNTTLAIMLSVLMSLIIAGCDEAPEYKDDVYGNFDALVEIIDTKYCYLYEKQIDWQEISSRYRNQLRSDMKHMELFDVCSRMLYELKDGHVNLYSRFDVSYYRKWWSDYPQDFNLRTLQEYYLKFDYRSISGMNYKVMTNGRGEKIGYIYYPSFSTTVSATALDYVLAWFEVNECKRLIIDIRNNGGGLLTNVDTFVGRFITSDITGGFIRHKTGPGHDDFSEPYRITYSPARQGHVMWDKDVIVLTNRQCYSAANNFVAVMKSLPQVKIAGSRTGGGGGLPFTSELPNGWAIRFSASPVSAPDGSPTEFGIDPSEGCECHSSEEALAEGKDEILEFALNH
ncbi:MAG: S41 family peptidase [Muribaculum sp.]|nr:S41 family peptidase [Muribaculum sp.]